MRKLLGGPPPEEWLSQGRVRYGDLGGDDIITWALHYAERRHPRWVGHGRNIADFATLVDGYTKGLFGGWGIPPEDSRYEVADQVILALTHTRAEPAALTQAGLRILEIIMFAPPEGHTVVAEAVELLRNTRGAFRSKQVARAREILERFFL